MHRPFRPAPLLAAAALSLAGCAPAARTAVTAPSPAAAPAGQPATSIAGRTAGMTRRDGFVPVVVDTRRNAVYLELPADTLRALLWASQVTGLGSTPVFLDRGASGAEHVARFVRSGDRVLVVLENWGYRSSDPANAALAASVEESFPQSVIAALPIVAEERGRLLVDAAELLYRDWMGIAATLQRTGQGSYSLARDRSAPYAARIAAHAEATELEAALTFTSSQPGRIMSTVAPDGQAVGVRQHLSIVRLPDGGYRPRVMDPRVGFFGIQFNDYAQPIQRPLAQRWVARHRLVRQDPADPRSPFVQPIVYYIDRGIPEPVRSATVEGARFWEQAFAQAGLAGGFVVRDLPEGADPQDARYNVVQWVSRHERGWSVGGALGDPRTGELRKGMARMDSHRARTDYNLYAGLLGADSAAADTAFVLARVRQVTAHEIGHTIGLAHNYIASTYERGSVMDYPPPRVRLVNGEIDLSRAYGTGPAEYDVWAVRWGYGIFPQGSEADSLAAIAREGLARGYLFLSDADARPEFASDPRTSLWDDAGTPAEFLRHQLDVRRVAMRRFGERNLRPGEPLSTLQERFAPVYFMHRFAVAALARAIGGMEYAPAMRGDGQAATRPVDARRQREALALLAGALAPAELAIPDTLLALLAPRPYGYDGDDRELFGARTTPAFDELGAARTLSQMVVDAVLQRERLARLVQQQHRDAGQLTLAQAVDALVATTWDGVVRTPRDRALRRQTSRAVTDRMLALAADDRASPDVRALVELKLARLRDDARVRERRGGDDLERAHWRLVADDVTRWLDRRELPRPTPALQAPPGDPFGG